MDADPQLELAAAAFLHPVGRQGEVAKGGVQGALLVRRAARRRRDRAQHLAQRHVRVVRGAQRAVEELPLDLGELAAGVTRVARIVRTRVRRIHRKICRRVGGGQH